MLIKVWVLQQARNQVTNLAYPKVFLNSLIPIETSPHELTLKVGAAIMLLQNLKPSQRLCNRTTITRL
jgi:hypothetical protein